MNNQHRFQTRNPRRPEGNRRPIESLRALGEEHPIAGLIRYLAASAPTGTRSLAR